MIGIATVLAFGTFYEANHGTAAAQQVVYHSIGFQLLLAFLAVNLAVAAFTRRPWKRRHLPFLLAHLGIITLLTGAVIGANFGIEGQMVIPEGQSVDQIRTPQSQLLVTVPSKNYQQSLNTQFHTRSSPKKWVLSGSGIEAELTADRYAADAVAKTEVTDNSSAVNPAIHLKIRNEMAEDETWLFSRQWNRSEARWGKARILFLEPVSDQQIAPLLNAAEPKSSGRGTLWIDFPQTNIQRQIEIPANFSKSVAVPGTPYTILFKDYFPDFVLTKKGPSTRSNRPENPAVALTVSGPEGTDPYLLFANHPQFSALHDIRHKIPLRIFYLRDAAVFFPPDSITLIAYPGYRHWAVVMTDEQGKRSLIDPMPMNRWIAHPSLGYEIQVDRFFARALAEEIFVSKNNEPRNERVRVTLRSDGQQAVGWVGSGAPAQLMLNGEPWQIHYGTAARAMPFSVKLLDFRKIDYPGTEMAAAFESDVEVTDAQTGRVFPVAIRMNMPLKYRGYSLFQSSFIPGEPETTVLSVRNDPGTPLVYTGFLIILSGVILLFMRGTAIGRRLMP